MTATDFVVQTKAKIAAITEPQHQAADLTNCDREPIHVPSAIQPHGVLIAFRPEDLCIEQVSQNTAEYLGRQPEELLGQPLTNYLRPADIQQIQNCLGEIFESPNPLRLAPEDGLSAFSGVVHRSGGLIVLELEPVVEQQTVDFFDFYSLVKQPVSLLQKTQTLEELCQVAVQEIQKVTGFDRVMVYRFDKDGAGSVVAERKRSEMTPYLGLRYPPTDIPKQAKYLYLLNLLRLIPDVLYEPVPLLTAGEQEPLDMSLSGLRSVSPLHTEYLTNMGVRASMSISLVCDRKLWGLIACHHNSPRLLPYETRTICEFLGQVIAMELASREASEKAAHKISTKAIQARFVDSLTEGDNLHQGLTQYPEALLELADAAGVAYCEKGDIFLIGHTPTVAEVGRLVDWLEHQFQQDVVYQTSSLSLVYPPASTFACGTSGLLALSISQVQQIYLLWFRPEMPQTVNWAGNPHKPEEVTEDGTLRISPRRSFALWQETLRQQALPWASWEIEAAVELRSAIVGLVLKKADELAQLNSELQRSNLELDSFAYVASHDLKEPLRGIHNYSSFLIEDYGDQLGDDGAKKLQTLMSLTQRMEDLINSLLHYSRLGRAELLIKPVNLNDVVRSVIEMIQIGKQGTISFQVADNLPSLECDYTQVMELFTNLITNAIKYNDKPEKNIQIGCLTAKDCPMPPPQDIGNAAVFYVRDNGIGIRKKHLEIVFRIFKRLHAPGRYGGGTGAGLTIVKKIVERHGGEIWIDSVYGEGTTFYFTLTEASYG